MGFNARANIQLLPVEVPLRADKHKPVLIRLIL